jgi:hypothetical protein
LVAVGGSGDAASGGEGRVQAGAARQQEGGAAQKKSATHNKRNPPRLTQQPLGKAWPVGSENNPEMKWISGENC